MVATIIVAALAAALLLILVLNFPSSEREVEKRIAHRYAVSDPQFLRDMGSLLGPAIVEGNHVRSLQNGDEIFPAMLDAIRSARQTICFETYIYWSGDIGRQFAEALSERAKAGVAVHVLLDWAGSAKMDRELIAAMRDAGVQVERYHPLTWYQLGRMNNRTHRKILVVDGRVGFTGGVGIADVWTGHAQDPEHWRDGHYQFEGPVVAQAQAVFMNNWIKTTGEVLTGDRYFPPLQRAGDTAAQMFSSSPTGGSETMQLMYLLAIASAVDTIDLAASYFIPDELTTDGLVAALDRGVRCRVIVPGRHIDAPYVRPASRARWGALLERGGRVFEYQPTMFHCKLMVVDGGLVAVGSTNFDNRSFRLNDEATLNIYDREVAAAMTRVFEADLERTVEITLAGWRARPLKERVLEWMTAPFAPLM